MTKLITTKQALEKMPWITYHGLYKGCKGTDVLTRYPHGMFDEAEIDDLIDSIITRGRKYKAKLERREPTPMELV